jgi:hypothetical protein
VISKESRCDDKSCSSFSKYLLASRLNFDLLLQYIIVASLIKNNKVIKEQGEILNTIKDYYEKLYTSKKTDEISSKEYIFDTKLEKNLNDKEKLDCDGEVTDTEWSEAIGNMKLNKSPGLAIFYSFNEIHLFFSMYKVFHSSP